MIVKDKLCIAKDMTVPMPELHHSGLWARTEIKGGYGIKQHPSGYSVLGEEVFSTENMVPLGGVQYAMSRIFEAAPTISVPTIYDQSGIGLPNKFIEDYDTYTYPVPATSSEPQEKTLQYPVGHRVCLFGIGITGSAENNVSQFPVDYKENSINMSRITTDGTILDGVMIPFRYTANELTEAEQTKYFGRKSNADGTTSYFLKAFETDVIIRHYYKTADTEEYIDAVDNTVWSQVSATKIDTFAEIVLKVSARDVKQWAEATSGIEKSKLNTIALFTGDYNPKGYSGVSMTGDEVTLAPDFQNVTMFSKLTIPTEPLELNKDLDIIYRVYGC
ncbi:MAG TPA: hypothetical protein DCW90_23115 [Lachnospiraceae bacterium]|mgnify:CR=1 FL=1|nr:hypothetical protein [Lachnospiraceae bacterium]